MVKANDKKNWKARENCKRLERDTVYLGLTEQFKNEESPTTPGLNL